MEYSFKFPRRQYCSLPFGVISYLLQTQSTKVLLKLQQSCKYFFARKSVIVADEDGMYQFDEEKNGIVFCNEDDKEILLLRKAQYWFTELCFFGDYDFCSNLRPSVYRLNLSSLTVLSAELSSTDIDFLLANNKLEALCLLGVDIHDAVGNAVPIDYVLRKVPNVTSVEYRNNSEVYSNQTWEKLNSIIFMNGFLILSVTIQQTSEELDPQIIGNFIENNMLNDSCAKLYFRADAPELKSMKAKFRQIKKNWTPRGAAPKFVVKKISP